MSWVATLIEYSMFILDLMMMVVVLVLIHRKQLFVTVWNAHLQLLHQVQDIFLYLWHDLLNLKMAALIMHSKPLIMVQILSDVELLDVFWNLLDIL